MRSARRSRRGRPGPVETVQLNPGWTTRERCTEPVGPPGARSTPVHPGAAAAPTTCPARPVRPGVGIWRQASTRALDAVDGRPGDEHCCGRHRLPGKPCRPPDLGAHLGARGAAGELPRRAARRGGGEPGRHPGHDGPPRPARRRTGPGPDQNTGPRGAGSAGARGRRPRSPGRAVLVRRLPADHARPRPPLRRTAAARAGATGRSGRAAPRRTGARPTAGPPGPGCWPVPGSCC